MKSVEQHLDDLRSLLPQGLPVQVAPLDAAGRVLAADVRALHDMPRFATSAMDGYAVRVADVPGTLHVAGEVAAGAVPTAEVAPGRAVRVMTGSMLPPGTEAVVPVEDTTDRGDEVEVAIATSAGRYLRGAGDDLRAGDLLLAAGTVVGPAQLAALVGLPSVSVRPVVRVAVLSTGDELVPPGTTPGPAQLVDSNGPGLAAAARAAGADVVRVGSSSDDPAAFLAALDALPACDLVVTSGGISMGAYDVVKDALRDRGVAFERVAVQPGMPQAWGRLAGGPAFLGLPGNPVSALVCFELFGRAVLHRERPWFPTRLRTAVDGSPADKLQLRRGRLGPDGVDLVGGPGSHLVAHLGQADCLVAVPVGQTEASAGTEIHAMSLRAP